MENISISPLRDRIYPRLVGVLVALFGLALAVGGARLVMLHGSAYFVLMGLASLVAGILLVRRRRSGAVVYGVAFVATVVWALADAGLAF